MAAGSATPVVDPDTAQGVARVLADAAAAGRRVRVRGGGTKSNWSESAQADLVLSTARLSRLIAHEHGDLTVEVEAGMTLRELNRRLRASGQWLPLDTAFDDATIGGILATNGTGPLR